MLPIDEQQIESNIIPISLVNPEQTPTPIESELNITPESVAVNEPELETNINPDNEAVYEPELEPIINSESMTVNEPELEPNINPEPEAGLLSASELTPELEPLHIQLGNTIENTNSGVRLIMSWTDGKRTVFEREYDSHVWTIHSRTGEYRELGPVFFAHRGDAFTVSFTTTTRVYHLYEDGTGHFKNLDGSNNEDLRWEFEITYYG